MRETINKMTGKPTVGEKIFANNGSNKDIIFIISFLLNFLAVE